MQLIKRAAILVASMLVVWGAEASNERWMSLLPDTVKVCRVSIPGTHDSGTAGVRFPMRHYARTQTMDLSRQWDAGIRFFDLRPKPADGTIKIYHGPADCHLTLQDALLTLKGKLESNPTEFCIVMINMAGGGQEGTDAVMSEIASLVPEDMIAPFDNNMTVSDLRGRIFFMSRNFPTNVSDSHGALVRGWPPNGLSFRSLLWTGLADARLWVQDYYTSGSNDPDAYLSSKWDNMYRLLRQFNDADEDYDVWCINHASGYTGTGIRTNIRRCSDYTNSHLMGYLKEHHQPIGIIPMDFPTQELIDAIIFLNTFTTD